MRKSVLWFFILICFIFTGCSALITNQFKKSVFENEDLGNFRDLENRVTIKRNNYGIPFIDAQSINDLAFACGYIDAADRLSQMISLKLTSQGRLSEMGGKAFIDLDLFMRSLNFRKKAESILEGSGEELLNALELYSRGVNEYIKRNKNNLGPNLKLSGYTPEKWTPYDSASVFVLLNFALSLNFHEEITALHFMEKVETDKIPYLFPVYPDEQLPFKEAEKLYEIEKSFDENILYNLKKVSKLMKDMGIKQIAASNNWAVSGKASQNKKSLLANDTHLPISLPGMWNMKHLRAPGFDAAGVAGVGLPAIVAGFNNNVAWGMTMVMADNQDIFVEKIRNINGKLHYLYKDEWIKTKERKEKFLTKKGDVYEMIVHETIHGPLINHTFKNKRVYELQPVSGEMSYAVSLSTPFIEKDDTLKQFYNLNRAKTAKEAQEYIKEIKTISLNLVFADKDNIGWQVTGVYPLREKGRGLFPSPGWTGDYDWNGYLSNEEFPFSFNPEKGYIITANHRTVPSDFGHVLSSSWYYPDRFLRIKEMLDSGGNDFDKMKKMHMDVKTSLPVRLRRFGIFSPFNPKIELVVSNMSEPEKSHSKKILNILSSFDGEMEKDSMEAAVYGAFLHCASKRIFFDEFGPADSPQWKSLAENEYYNYSPIHDHLLQRDSSPFFDNIETEKKESKYEIIAYAMADTYKFLEKKLGEDMNSWKWGDLHKYYFETETSKMSDHLGFFKQIGMNLLSDYFNRGPYRAPGDAGTVNVSANAPSKGFDVWMIPSMRIIADFSKDEPFYGVNSTGQSGHPSSPHYDDGIELWLKGEYMNFPFKKENIDKVYENSFVLTP